MTDANFSGILHARPQNLSRKIGGRFNSLGLNLMTIRSEKQCSTTENIIRDVSKLKQWMIDV